MLSDRRGRPRGREGEARVARGQLVDGCKVAVPGPCCYVWEQQRPPRSTGQYPVLYLCPRPLAPASPGPCPGGRVHPGGMQPACKRAQASRSGGGPPSCWFEHGRCVSTAARRGAAISRLETARLPAWSPLPARTWPLQPLDRGSIVATGGTLAKAQDMAGRACLSPLPFILRPHGTATLCPRTLAWCQMVCTITGGAPKTAAEDTGAPGLGVWWCMTTNSCSIGCVGVVNCRGWPWLHRRFVSAI